MNESRVILVPNVPWLKSGTVKENILFGSAFRKDDYESVIDACGLREDFKRLPLKDRVRHSHLWFIWDKLQRAIWTMYVL